MAKRGIAPMHDEHINVTPLIDVVMCLIIFFMICGKLVKDDVNKDVTVPKALDTPQELTGDLSGRLIINLVPNAEGPHNAVNIQPQVIVRGKKLETLNSLIPYLRDEKRKSPNIRVVLRADEELPYEHIAPVLVACAMADIKSVHFSTRQK